MSASGSVATTDEHFTLLASAMAGRSVSVERRAISSPYTDGQTIYLPLADHQFVLTSVMVQSSLLAAGSIDPEILSGLIGRPQQARRYVTLEAARAYAELGAAGPRRLESVVRAHWDGEVTVSARDSLRRASSREAIPLAPVEFGTVRPAAVLRARVDATGAQLSSRRPAMRDESAEEEEDDDDDDEGDVSFLMKLMSSPIGWENPLLKAILHIGGKRTPKRDGSDSGAELKMTGARATLNPSEHARLVQGPVSASSTRTVRLERELRYPEWDVQLGEYRPEWCAVHEFEAPVSAEQPPLPNTDFLLRRGLVKLGMTFERHERQPIGEGLDASALVEFAICSAMGELDDENVYEARLRTAHDLGVVVLLDASGSTADRSGSTSAVWDEQRVLTANLVSEMEHVGHRVAALAFRSWGRHKVNLLRIKDFDVRWGSGPRHRLAGLEPAGFTRMGTAVRHASHLLETKAGTGNRLLVVVSDGFAYDEDKYVDRYAEADTRRALEEAARRGVACVCISVGASTEPGILDRTWGNTSYVNLHQAEHPDRLVVPVLRTAIRTAASAIR